MPTKQNSETLRKADPNEPIFVLRARDMSAPEVIEFWTWINRRTLSGHRLRDAERLADAMRKWPERKWPD